MVSYDIDAMMNASASELSRRFENQPTDREQKFIEMSFEDLPNALRWLARPIPDETHATLFMVHPDDDLPGDPELAEVMWFDRPVLICAARGDGDERHVIAGPSAAKSGELICALRQYAIAKCEHEGIVPPTDEIQLRLVTVNDLIDAGCFAVDDETGAKVCEHPIKRLELEAKKWFGATDSEGSALKPVEDIEVTTADIAKLSGVGANGRTSLTAKSVSNALNKAVIEPVSKRGNQNLYSFNHLLSVWDTVGCRFDLPPTAADAKRKLSVE